LSIVDSLPIRTQPLKEVNQKGQSREEWASCEVESSLQIRFEHKVLRGCGFSREMGAGAIGR
jgi:hypothetical protein